MLHFGSFLAGCALGGVALAQFDGSLPSSTYAELLSGDLVAGEGGVVPAVDDEIGVFFGEELVGQATLTASQAESRAYSVLVFGDDPNTGAVEGPAVGEPITFRFFDASTNTVITDVRVVNADGEAVNFTFQGGESLPPEIPLPPELRFQGRSGVTLRIGGGGDDGSGGGGGGGETPSGDPDVDGDGAITRKDAAMVLRVVVGGGRLVDEATRARADVNGDGQVTTEDAIAVLRAR